MNLKILFSLIIVVLCGILGSNLKKKITGKIAVLREISSFLNFAQFQITMQANDLYMCIRNHNGRVKLLTPLRMLQLTLKLKTLKKLQTQNNGGNRDGRNYRIYGKRTA